MKWKCAECDALCNDETMLNAPSPFDNKLTIYGCPNCLDVNTLQAACDEPDCTQLVTCGTPTSDGYRNTCSTHVPPKDKP